MMVMTQIPLNFMGEEFIADVDYRVTYYGAPAQGPSYCSGGEPAEGPEWEIEYIALRRDYLDGFGPEFEATGALFHHLANLDKISDAISEEICEDGPPEPDYDYDHDF